MSRKGPPKGHTGQTDKGATRDVKVERIGRVTIYKRGRSYYVYYREKGQSVRRIVEGNLNTARQVASSANHAVEEGRPSPLQFERIPIPQLIDDYIDNCEHVRGSALRTVDRYRAALSHFKRFAESRDDLKTACSVDERAVEDFVKWMRKQDRTRNGQTEGARHPYRASGIKFILSTCRSVFNWAARRRCLPPYSENPFATFAIDKMAKREHTEVQILTEKQQESFFAKCDDWQKRIFLTLAMYGMRVGELTHLLISDVDWEGGTFCIQSKPDMYWHVKTCDHRILPILPETRWILEDCRQDRKAGLLFLNRGFAENKKGPCEEFASEKTFSERLRQIADEARQEGADSEKDVQRAVRKHLRAMGQIPEKRIRQEFMKLTKAIGCPELTRAHSLRHLFSTRAQEQGMNPLLVQGLLGHADLDMTRRYTHFGVEAKREAVHQMLNGDPILQKIIQKRSP